MKGEENDWKLFGIARCPEISQSQNAYILLESYS
jgi:hypothetical protein